MEKWKVRVTDRKSKPVKRLSKSFKDLKKAADHANTVYSGEGQRGKKMSTYIEKD